MKPDESRVFLFKEFAKLAWANGLNEKINERSEWLHFGEASPLRDGCGLRVRGRAAQPIPMGKPLNARYA